MKLFTTIFILAGILLFNAPNISAEIPSINAVELNSKELSENQNERPIAIVRRFRPDVVVSTNNGEWVAPRNAHQLFASDTLRTGEEGFAVVQFMDNSVAKMRPNSVLIITGEIGRDGSTAARLAMELGEVFMEVRGRNSNYEVATPSAVAAVRGTGFNVKSDESGSEVVVTSGSVEVTSNTGESSTVGAGTMASVTQQGSLSTQPTPQEIADAIQQANDEADEPQQDETIEDIILRFENADGQIEEIRIRYRRNNE